MNGDLKLTFVLKCLQDYNEQVIDAFKRSAARQKVGVTGEGILSLAYTAVQQGGGAASSLNFNEYLRMVDMGAGRGHPLGGLRSMKKTLQSKNKTGKVLVKDRMRPPKKIYSKTAYGKLNWLINELLYGYTETTIAVLKEEMEKE